MMATNFAEEIGYQDFFMIFLYLMRLIGKACSSYGH